jgi:2-haloacid dehalogenase
MDAWPDVVPSLEAFKKIGLRTCLSSNMTAKMLHSNIQHSGISDQIDIVISTDEKRTYKPDGDAYQMAVDKLKLKKEEILFAPFAGWDMAGAKWFGFPTFWVNRSNDPVEKLDVEPEGTGSDLTSAVEFVKRIRS